MFGPNVGQIAKLVATLTSGDDNLLDKILHDKLDELGEEFLMKYSGGAVRWHRQPGFQCHQHRWHERARKPRQALPVDRPAAALAKDC